MPGLAVVPTELGIRALWAGSCRLSFPTSVKMDCMCNSVTSSYTCTEECSRSVISLTDNCFYGNHGNLTGLLVVWYQTLKSDSSVVSIVTLSLIN